jgi:Caspase domain
MVSHLLTACVQFPPSRTYDADPVNYQPSTGMVTTQLTGHAVTIEANQPWQSSGVHVAPGERVKILAMGKWSQAPAMNVWSGPEGLEGIGKEVPWIKANALMGKIGEQGKPFEVGAATEFRSTGEGEVYLAINDPFNWVKDNSGSMQVTIFTEKPSSAGASAAATNNPSSLALAPEKNVAITIAGEMGKRTALVIGNSEYEVGSLRNPANDAQDMAGTLVKLGFDVTLKLNADQAQMEHAISEFGRQLYQGGVGLFYYAGHGVQVDGENYLIPVKAKLESESDVRYKAVNIGQVLGKMGEARNGFNIVILDACRDNPFAKSFRSASRGLAVVNSAAVKGTLVAYATSPGNVASDGEARNGLYTKHLLQNIAAPGLPVEQVFKRVLQGVEQDTNGKQSPWTSSSFSGDFSFNPVVQ